MTRHGCQSEYCNKKQEGILAENPQPNKETEKNIVYDFFIGYHSNEYKAAYCCYKRCENGVTQIPIEFIEINREEHK